ncbi:type IV pilin protein [Solimonas variicoloris]|uniref:type IV pilin protein n=1 Tax=Solimonas variicoloris TaxID=254408 RepID=UPI0003819B57|nr:type IV pilin protein [Solimonas variicoloris]
MNEDLRTMSEHHRRSTGARRQSGFTLIELIIAVAIVGILAAIAYPSYINSITKTKRRAAEVCLSSYATFMERFYTTNLRYDEDLAGNAMNSAALQALGLDCASDQNTGKDYSYAFESVAAAAYTLKAVPIDAQADRDTRCGTLTLDHTGTRGATGSAGVAECW